MSSSKISYQVSVDEKPVKTGFWAKFQTLSDKVDSLGAEARGIERVEPDERDAKLSKLNMLSLWCSGCGSLTSASGFFLGPVLLGLSLKDSLISGIFGALFGALMAAFTSTFGPKSGLRQMVGSRFVFGWYGSPLLGVLNFISLCGFSIVNCVFGGQILNALSNGKCPVEVGIVIISVISGIVAIVGIKWVHMAERWMSIPLMLFFLLAFICGGKDFDNSTPSSGDSLTVAGNCLSFFTICFGINAGWGAIASDYYTLFPEDTSSIQVFTLTLIGVFVPSSFVGALAICIASAYLSLPKYQDSYEVYGAGGLLDQALSRWNGGGKFILFVLFLSLFTNNILNFYSMPLTVQIVHQWLFRFPRWFLTIVGFIVVLVCSMAGRSTLSTYLNNFLPMIGYWILMFVTISLEEFVLFRGRSYKNYDWSLWNNKHGLTHGYSAIIAFLCGIAGAVIGMCQAYYIGPVAVKIGEYGGDVGLWLCMGISGIVYPPCRFLELRHFKK